MKDLLIAIILLSVVHTVVAQENQPQHRAEFGIDLSQGLVWIAKGDLEYTSIDLLSRFPREKGDLRLNFTYGNENWYGRELIQNRLLEDNLPDNQKYIETKYNINSSYQLSVGASRYLPNNTLPVYYGLDLGVGRSSGYSETNFLTRTVAEETTELVDFGYSTLSRVSAVPFVGIKLYVSSDLLFAIEFGAPFHYLFGEIEYFDQASQPKSLSTNGFYFDGKKLLHDIGIFITI